MRVCVIGAGLFGCMTALKLAEQGYFVDLIEQSSDILQGASKHNQNRIHFGYHYPRSIKTTTDSLIGFESFRKVFNPSIEYFDNYYAIANEGSKSTPEDFEAFCNNMNIWLKQEYPDDYLLNKKEIAKCYKVNEPIFNYGRMKAIVKYLLANSNVDLHLNTIISDIRDNDQTYHRFVVTTNRFSYCYRILINTTYSNINCINKMLNLPLRTYLFEDVVIPKFHYEHKPFGITIMDGPFCSVLPYGGNDNQFLLSHVKYSVFSHKFRKQETKPVDLNINCIFDASSKFMPFLKTCKPHNTYHCRKIIWENKDDSRQSIIYNDLPNYYSVLSGKVTTCIDVANNLVGRIKGC